MNKCFFLHHSHCHHACHLSLGINNAFCKDDCMASCGYSFLKKYLVCHLFQPFLFGVECSGIMFCCLPGVYPAIHPLLGLQYYTCGKLEWLALSLSLSLSLSRI